MTTTLTAAQSAENAAEDARTAIEDMWVEAWEEVQARADANGITFAEQQAMDEIWEESWTDRPDHPSWVS